jgi:type III secretion protein L
MAFILPRSPLKPARSLWLGIDPATQVVRAHEMAALREAQQIVADAQVQADAIVAGAHEALEAERQRGYAQGLEEAQLDQAEQMIENVSRTIDYFSKVEGRVVDLVMQSIQKIVSEFDDTERVVITVKNVLAVVRNRKQMTLRLNPQQVDLIKARVNDLLADYPGVGFLDIVVDTRVKLDACILESDIGLVEASMEGQIAALRSAFEKVLGSRI